MSSYNDHLVPEMIDVLDHSPRQKPHYLRFFFHLANGEESIPDMSGIEAKDLDTAHLEAMKAVRELLQEEEGETDPTDWTGWCLNIADASGSVLLSFQLGALQAHSRRPHKRYLNA